MRVAHVAGLRDLSRGPALDWELVFDTARRHGVAPLVGHNLQQHAAGAGLPVPESIARRFLMAKSRHSLVQRRRITALTAGLDVFQAHGIDVMPVKGAALDLLVYDHPWYTRSDDLDIVLRAEDDASLPQPVRDLLPDLVAARVEYDFYTHHDITMNGTLPVSFDAIWRDSVEGVWENRPIRLMTWEDMLLSLCINSCRKRFFRLKAVCDCAETVKRAGDRLDWDLFIVKTEVYGCGGIVYAALSAADQTVGASLPQGLLDALPVAAVRRRALDQLLNRASLAAYDSIFEGREVFGRNVDASLLLQYAALQSSQLARKARFVWRTRDRQTVKPPPPEAER